MRSVAAAKVVAAADLTKVAAAPRAVVVARVAVLVQERAKAAATLRLGGRPLQATRRVWWPL